MVNVLIVGIWNGKGISERWVLRSIEGLVDVGGYKFIMELISLFMKFFLAGLYKW